MSSREAVDQGRRAFLRGTLFTADGRQRLRRSRERLGPAPPWIGPHLSVETCGDCDAPCLPSCQPGVLQRHEPEHADGMPSARGLAIDD